jgi:hypothetical protein
MQDCFLRRKIDTPPHLTHNTKALSARHSFRGTLFKEGSGAEQRKTEKSVSYSLTHSAFLVIFLSHSDPGSCLLFSIHSPPSMQASIFTLLSSSYLSLSIYI